MVSGGLFDAQILLVHIFGESVRAMHIFELLKKLAEIVRPECQIDTEIDTLQAKRVQSKQFKTANKSRGLSLKRLAVRIRKLLNFFFRILS